jgi:dihydrofolate synthase/folylpolyglutamate synthase
MQPTIDAELAENPGRLSTFEILTAMGFRAFQQAEVDVQVVEVGLGGRLDSTNVLRETAVAVVTALSWEHADVLGESLTKIAAEKAGIITANTSAAVLAPQRASEAASTVRDYAAEMQVPLIDVGARYRWEPAGIEQYEQTRGQWFRVWQSDAVPATDGAKSDSAKTDGGTLYLFPLLGVHQIENAVAALAVVDALREQGFTIPSDAVHRGLATVAWPGRLETVSRDPWIVVDAAHNEESLERVLEALPQYFDYERLIVVLGVLGDKNVQAMASHLHDAAAVIVTQPNHPRARAAALVAQAIRSSGSFTDETLFVEPRVEDALRAAALQATPGDLICVLGSLFVAAEARGRIKREVGGEPTSARADR